MTSTTEVLAPIAAATGGDSRRLDDGNGVDVPRILAVRSGDTYKGDDWIGLKMRDASVVRGIGVLPVFAGLLGLLLLLGSLAGTWAREGPLGAVGDYPLALPWYAVLAAREIKSCGIDFDWRPRQGGE